MIKQEIRKIYLQKRLALSTGDYLHLSRQLCDLFFVSLDLSAVRTLHLYLPIETKKEPDTWLIIERLRREYPHIKITVPRVEGDRLENYYFDGPAGLIKNEWGIPEPLNGVSVPAALIDLIVVPLLAFDKKGHRVGYGKGFYDRLIAACREDCLKTGISFFPPLDHIDNVNSFDIGLNSCLTPEKIYLF